MAVVPEVRQVYQGSGLRLTGLFKNMAGTRTDPTTVTLTVVPPSGSNTVYYYNVQGHSNSITRESTGLYHVDFSSTSTVGDWYANYVGTGAVAAVQEERFIVLAVHT